MPETKPAIPARFGAREAQPLEGFLASTKQFDLDKLLERADQFGTVAIEKELAAARAQVAAQWREIAEKYPAAIEWLCDISLRRPVHLPMLGAEGQLYAAHRDGANALAWQIIQAIAEGRDQPPPMREGI
jgi:hypothetical protein